MSCAHVCVCISLSCSSGTQLCYRLRGHGCLICRVSLVLLVTFSIDARLLLGNALPSREPLHIRGLFYFKCWFKTFRGKVKVRTMFYRMRKNSKKKNTD
uniref:Putative secreted protein n=1 Tax=Anopheles darlingi TaxID=43151 RepID=A0A2M4DQN4_ANODA